MAHKRNGEEDVLVRYLTGKPATSRVTDSYRDALQHVDIVFSSEQQRLMDSCLELPWIIPHVDAWLGFRHPHHPLRKKMFIMLAILETQPDYNDLFLPTRHSFFYLVNIGITSIWAIIKIGTGRIITWMM